MPHVEANLKLFGAVIDDLRGGLEYNLGDYLSTDDEDDKKSSERTAQAKLRRLMAAISLATDPKYANMEQLPEGENVDTLIRERQKTLESNIIFQKVTENSADSLIKFVASPQWEWKNKETPKIRPYDLIQKYFNLEMEKEKERQEELGKPYRLSTSQTGPNMLAFGDAIGEYSKKVNRYLKKIDDGDDLSEEEMQSLGEEFTSLMGIIEAANDPKYAGKRRMSEDDIYSLRNTREIDNLRKSPAFKELFRHGHEQSVLTLICGSGNLLWKDNEPVHMPYQKIKSTFDKMLVVAEENLYKKKLKTLWKQAKDSEGEERSRAIANIIALHDRRKNGKDIFNDDEIKNVVDKSLENESFRAVTGGEQAGKLLQGYDDEIIENAQKLAEKVMSKQVAFNEQKEQEKKRAQEEEELRKQREKEEEERRQEEEERRREEEERRREEELAAQPPKTAYQFIEEEKANLRQNLNEIKNQDNYPEEYIARILAARDAVGSERGKGASLKKPLDMDTFTQKLNAIRNNPSFLTFVEKIKAKPELHQRVDAIFLKKHSHGGELDDMFRDFLKKRPAGELQNNDEILERWMPTVKERVEALQKDAAKRLKENKDANVSREAFEILKLRTMAGVRRGGMGLEQKVPFAKKNSGNDLTYVMNEEELDYEVDRDFRDLFERSGAKKHLLSGHGGKMKESFDAQKKKEQQPERKSKPAVL